MSETSSYNSKEEDYERLVAYLDGELDVEGSQLVERRLAEDGDFRRELQQLQQAWDMLDELPKAEVSPTFTQTTVEMVALSAEQHLEEARGKVKRTKFVWRAIAGGGVIAASVASFWLVSGALRRANDRLVDDLPVIENVDLYQVAESVEFLKQLDAEGLFDEEVDDAL